MRTHLKPYQQQRIETSFIRKRISGAQATRFCSRKLRLAPGDFGAKGFGKGSQNQLGFVPVRYSDFILAALAEEQGFIGVCVVLLLYLGLILRLVDNAQKAKDRAGMYVVDGSHGDSGFPRSGERFDGDRIYAGHRHSAAADELWRVVDRVCIFGFGFGDERPHAAVRQLSPASQYLQKFSLARSSGPPRNPGPGNPDLNEGRIG